jgi:uncharacterized protein (TIGR00661 family)
MPQPTPKKILIVPLDWGLGHTTRCIPIIKELIQQNCTVHIGGTQITNAILAQEFLDCQYHIFPSYGISYPEKASQFLKYMILQLPQMYKVVKEENRLTKELLEQYGYDLIISDNRFGVHNKKCKSVFITHQLNVAIPQSKFLEYLTNKSNQFYINKFDKVLIPDWENHLLTGELSSEMGIRPSISYLGCISRWGVEQSQTSVIENSILVILSGPEPQRTMLENMLMKQSLMANIRLTIVRAKPNETDKPVQENIVFYNHLKANDLQELVLKSEIVISRAGYTTIMDLVSIQKNAILIPTPGQTEQEYLAARLESQNLFQFYSQSEFNLNKAIEKFQTNEWSSFPKEKTQLKEKISELINELLPAQ